MIKHGFAPVILFVFNRPDHTRRCLEALSLNVGVEMTEIHVFADGPKNSSSDDDKLLIKEVRDVVNHFKDTLNIEMHLSVENNGLASSILKGVSKLFDDYESVIVLEDDLLCSKYFLSYMNNCLTYYKDEHRVMHVGGYSPTLKLSLNEDCYLLSFASSWGWGTWKDRWRKFMVNPNEIINEIDRRKAKSKFNFNDSYPFYDMLQRQVAGEIDSWAIRWNGTVFLEGGLGIYPRVSLVQNVGFDGSGVHSGTGDWYNVKLKKSHQPDIKIKSIEENKLAREKVGEFYSEHDKVSFWDKVKQKIKYEIKNAKGSSY